MCPSGLGGGGKITGPLAHSWPVSGPLYESIQPVQGKLRWPEEKAGMQVGTDSEGLRF